MLRERIIHAAFYPRTLWVVRLASTTAEMRPSDCSYSYSAWEGLEWGADCAVVYIRNV